MTLLLDEMHAPAVAVRLRAAGIDAVAVGGSPELVGLPDAQVLVVATADGRAVVTEDVRDYSMLHRDLTARGRGHAGIVLTHPKRFPRSAGDHVQVLAAALARFVEQRRGEPVATDSFVWWLERPSAA